MCCEVMAACGIVQLTEDGMPFGISGNNYVSISNNNDTNNQHAKPLSEEWGYFTITIVIWTSELN
jgi:hypothetical protein